MNMMLFWAQKYLKLGWSVVPIPKGKKYPIIEWKEYQKRKATNEELVKWFADSQNHIAIVTGYISGLTVIDADTPQALQWLSLRKIASPISVRTRHGRHLYFTYCPNAITTTEILNVDNLDCRNDGGVAVAPPSLGYNWLWPDFTLALLPSLPDGLFGQEKVSRNLSETKGRIADALRNLKNGNRDNTFVSLIGSLRRSGYNPDDVMEMLTPHARRVSFDLGVLKEKIAYAEKAYPIEETRLSKSITIYSTRHNWKDYEERKASKESKDGPELRTGYIRLDSMLYGLRRGELYTIGARTGIGKTSLCVNISSNLLRQSKRVLFLSTEMSYDTIWNRMERINDKLREVELFTSDISSPTKAQIEQMIQQTKPDVVVMDHIQHMGDSITGRYQELSKLIKSFKDLARENNIAIIVASQLNRSADMLDRNGKQATPKLYHLKECGSIEEESTVVMLLHRQGLNTDGSDFYILNVAKNRYGTCGEIQIGFNKQTGKMVEI